MKKLFAYLMVLAVCLCLVPAPGCTPDRVAALKTTLDQAKVVQVDVAATIATTEAAIKALPENDPMRVALEAKVVKAKEYAATLGKWIDTTQATIDGLQKGAIPAEVVAAASAIPYVGPYVPLIAVLLPSIIALFQSGQVKKYKDSFQSVVAAWHVGPDLSPEHQALAESIAGPKVAPLLRTPAVPIGPDNNPWIQ